jgi:uncharacterized protein
MAMIDRLEEILAQRINLGVTGLRQAGKTVFITSLVHNLLRADPAAQRSPLRNFDPFDQGRLVAATLRHDTNATVPQFPYNQAVGALTGQQPHWPARTDGISRIRLDIKYRRGDGLIGTAARWLGLGDAVLQLDIVDYPGEWLVDLPMLSQDFEAWSAAMLRQAQQGVRAALARDWLACIAERDASQPHDEEWAANAAALYADYLRRCATAGLRYLQPGRLLTPAELKGAPVLRFCPLPPHDGQPRSNSLHAAFAAKYRDYQENVIRTFYRRHFAGIDRQIVLVDVLTALNAGAEIFDDMSAALAAILQSFDHGRSGLLRWLTGRRIDRVVFAATKADHVVRGDRIHLEHLTQRMLHVLDESNRIKSAAGVKVEAIASVRCTDDMRRSDTGREILLGRRHGDAADTPLDPGAIPLDFPPPWDSFKYRFWDFQPRADPAWRYGGFPNIGVPEALNYLLGDHLS